VFGYLNYDILSLPFHSLSVYGYSTDTSYNRYFYGYYLMAWALTPVKSPIINCPGQAEVQYSMIFSLKPSSPMTSKAATLFEETRIHGRCLLVLLLFDPHEFISVHYIGFPFMRCQKSMG
jgi:hypothetical protein